MGFLTHVTHEQLRDICGVLGVDASVVQELHITAHGGRITMHRHDNEDGGRFAGGPHPDHVAVVSYDFAVEDPFIPKDA